MSNNPFAAQIRKEESLYSAQIAKAVDKALLDRKIVQMAQPAAKYDGKKAPKVTQSAYRMAASKAVAKMAKKYPGLQIDVELTYSNKVGNWFATSNVFATYPMKKVGGKVHKVACEENFWTISEKYYGSGVFWTVLADYNPQVILKGKYLRAGAKVHVPKIDVIDKICVLPSVNGKSAPKNAKLPAKNISYPHVVLKFDKKKSMEVVIPTPTATLKLALSISGALSVGKPGVIPMKFDPRKHTASIEAASEHFRASFSITDFKDGALTVSNKASGNNWKVSFKIKPNGTISLTVAPQAINFTHKGLVYSGSIAVTLEMTYILHYVPQPRGKLERIGDWVSDHQKELIVGFAALPVAAAAVTSTGALLGGSSSIKWIPGLAAL